MSPSLLPARYRPGGAQQGVTVPHTFLPPRPNLASMAAGQRLRLPAKALFTGRFLRHSDFAGKFIYQAGTNRNSSWRARCGKLSILLHFCHGGLHPAISATKDSLDQKSLAFLGSPDEYFLGQFLVPRNTILRQLEPAY